MGNKIKRVVSTGGVIVPPHIGKIKNKDKLWLWLALKGGHKRVVCEFVQCLIECDIRISTYD